MVKYLSKVMALIAAVLMAAPATMAQAQRALLPLATASELDGEFGRLPFSMLRTGDEMPAAGSQLSRQASMASMPAMLSYKSAGFSPDYVRGSQKYFGVVYAQDGMKYVNETQMYRFSAQAPATAQELSLWKIARGANLGAVMGEKYFYVTDARISASGASIKNGKVYDPETWELVKEVPISNDLTSIGQCAAYDPVTGNIYKIGFQANGVLMQLGIFDPETFASAKVANIDRTYTAISCSADGVIYAIDDDGNFGTINKTTGAFTLIKATGLACNYYTSGAIDYLAASPVFYYALPGETQSDLYAIDCATGEYTHVYTYANHEKIVGMYFQRPVAELDAPGEPELLAASFEGQALSGTVSFAVPAGLYSGDSAPAGQKLRYEIIANGKVVRSGADIDYGHSYKVKVDMDAPGLYAFNVVVYNEAGPGPKSNRITRWVGPDAPAAVKNVNAAWAAGKMTLTWDAVEAGAHDGTIGNVTYAVYNAADSALIKDAITATSFEMDVKEPAEYTEFQYFVVAVSDGMESEAGLSNVVALGNYVAPFSTSVNTASVADWTIVDANADRNTWRLMADAARYSYSFSKNADDWLITTPIVVKPGYLYNVTISAKANGYPEKFEVKAGSAPTAEAMTIDVIGQTTIKTSAYKPYSGTFVAESDLVYIGVHCTSDKLQGYFFVNELSIDAGVNGNAPRPATDLGVLVPYSGENHATLSYTAPTATIGGADLAGDKALTRVEVFLNDELVYIDNKPTAGAMSSIEIDVPAFGVYDFKVIAYNALGAGEPAEISAYVGINKPAAVANAKVTEVTDGVVDITWDPVTTDISGNIMNPALVTYSVGIPSTNQDGQLQMEVLAEGLTEPCFNNYKVAAPGTQKFVQYVVLSETEAGYSIAFTDMPAVGTPYALPYSETFADGKVSHILAIGQGDDWVPFDDESGLVSRNKDNGFIACYSQFMELFGQIVLVGNGYGELISGKIAVTEADPELSFYFYGLGPDCPNTITTSVICEGQTKVADVVKTAGNAEWVRHAIDLKEYSGKTVQIVFRADIKSAKYFLGSGFHGFIDDIRLGDPVEVDIVAKSISAPSVVTTEQAFQIDYTVYNQGCGQAKNVFVSLYADGNLVESSVDTLTVEAGQTVNGTFDQKAFSLFESGAYEFSYVVNCEADQDLTNNTSPLAKVAVANSDMPSLQLSGSLEVAKEDSTATVSLAWDVPAIDVSSLDVVESFESASYPAYSTESFGGWTLLNFNDNPTYGIEGATFPGAGTAFGWILFDAADAGLNDAGSGYAAYEGSCYMAAFTHLPGPNDAWLISPNLAGIAQTVTFMAMGANTSYGAETMECLVSFSGKDVADFAQVEIQGYDPATGVTEQWTKYTIDVPAGAQYFAIRSTSDDAFMLMVDNIAYHYTSPFFNLELKGYDVYRDQVKLNAQPLANEQYTDVVKKNGTYAYTVVAVYDQGNSAPSNVYSATVDFTHDGIADAEAGATVAVEGREIVVAGAERVAIAAVDGKLVYAGASARVAVAPGVYAVKADDTVVKVIVK